MLGRPPPPDDPITQTLNVDERCRSWWPASQPGGSSAADDQTTGRIALAPWRYFLLESLWEPVARLAVPTTSAGRGAAPGCAGNGAVSRPQLPGGVGRRRGEGVTIPPHIYVVCWPGFRAFIVLAERSVREARSLSSLPDFQVRMRGRYGTRDKLPQVSREAVSSLSTDKYLNGAMAFEKQGTSSRAVSHGVQLQHTACPYAP